MNLKTYFIFFLLLINCKKDYSSKNFNSSKKDNFSITLKAKVPSDDVFELFYKNNLEAGFSEAKKVSRKVIGKNEIQNIEFLVNANEFPFQFRIDLGQNKKQKDLMIREVILKYKNDSIIIEKELLSTFFIVNKYLSLDSENGIFKIIELNGKSDPFIISKALLVKKMEIEL